ncbi:forkhead domain 3F isoform X2 [Haematobia irritans]|uniref:forkhead domain 3F isoform X2 n=1 Tax=Haematobia irritans TaxID=7368 RepID=UPI003F5069AF
MILNTPVTNGAITSSVPSSQGQSEFCDFLKRKYPESDISSSASNPSSTEPPVTASYAENHDSGNTNVWKKPRHTEDNNSYEMPSTHNTSINSYNHNSNVDNSPNSTEYISSGTANAIISTTSAAPTPVSNSGSFNIMANSSAFINDLFTYDANLLVPSTSGDSSLGHGEPTFTTPSTICVNSTQQFEEDQNDNWQATDLLELDHRYNSTLQTEITHLNPTVSLKPHEETLVTLAEQKHNPHSPLENHPLHSNQTAYVAQTPKSPLDRHSCGIVQSLDNDADFEDRNLSWLLNFKFDEFPHLNPDLAASNIKSSKSQNSGNSVSYKSPNGSSQISGLGNGRERSKSPKNSNKTGKKFEELVMEVTSEMDGNDMVVAENVIIEDTTSQQRAPKKPPFTYTELIEYALEDKGELTVSGIYSWISDRFPYYKSNDDRWKNSVRHNLSINPHFRKGHKAPQGAGHLWTISSGDSAENVLAWEHKKQRLDLFFKMESMNRERLAQHHQQMQQQSNANCRQQQQPRNTQHHNNVNNCSQDPCQYDEAAMAAAAIKQEMLQQQQTHSGTNDSAAHHCRNITHIGGSESTSHQHHQQSLHDLPYNELLSEEELRKTAGQILNGIHREVEVQSVNHQSIISTYQDVLLDNDYLNPIHKDVAVNESGLRHLTSSSSQCHTTSTPYYVTEIDPLELGIQMSSHPHPLAHSHTTAGNQHHHHHHHHHGHHNQHHHQQGHDANTSGEETEVVLFNDEFNLNYFTYNSATDIVA